MASTVPIRHLHRITRKPRLFEDSRRLFWADPYIARHTLEAHLDPETDAASRPPEQVEGAAAFVAAKLEGRKQADSGDSASRSRPRVLDLGCGPGLIAKSLAARGLEVRGVDVSPASIGYARKHSAPYQEQLRYEQEDYLEAELAPASFDAVILVYGGFGTISNRDRRRLLKKIRGALEPGGLFIFDAFTSRYLDAVEKQPEWSVLLNDGFWSPKPHLLLFRSYDYPEDRVRADRYITLFKDGSTQVYTIWHRYYEPDELRGALQEAGFRNIELYRDLEGSPYRPGSRWIGAVAYA